MWKTISDSITRVKDGIVDRGKRAITFLKDLSRPARVGALAAKDITKTKVELIAESALLRQQLIFAKRHIKQAHLSKPEKLAMTFWARLTKWWQGAILLVQPDTILRWHRDAFKLVWWFKSRPKNPKPPEKIAKETIQLIAEMAKKNRTWGAERIRGELLKLGIDVAKRTVQKYMRRARKGTSPGSQTWATFIENHAHEIWAYARSAFDKRGSI
jgi:hypothetical protein